MMDGMKGMANDKISIYQKANLEGSNCQEMFKYTKYFLCYFPDLVSTTQSKVLGCKNCLSSYLFRMLL